MRDVKPPFNFQIPLRLDLHTSFEIHHVLSGADLGNANDAAGNFTAYDTQNVSYVGKHINRGTTVVFHPGTSIAAGWYILAARIPIDVVNEPGQVFQWHINGHIEASGSGADVDITPIMVLGDSSSFLLGAGNFVIRLVDNTTDLNPLTQAIPLPIREYETRDHVHLDSNGLINFQHNSHEFGTAPLKNTMALGILINVAGSSTNLEGQIFVDGFFYDQPMPINTPMGV